MSAQITKVLLPFLNEREKFEVAFPSFQPLMSIEERQNTDIVSCESYRLHRNLENRCDCHYDTDVTEHGSFLCFDHVPDQNPSID